MAPEDAATATWRRIALDPPRALGECRASGTIRAESTDFVVEQRLGFEPDGGGAHFLVQVEKQDANTLHVARELAASVGRPPAEIGFAGMKDRRAVARQWFSVPAVKGKEPAAGAIGSGYRVLAAHPHIEQDVVLAVVEATLVQIAHRNTLDDQRHAVLPHLAAPAHRQAERLVYPL